MFYFQSQLTYKFFAMSCVLGLNFSCKNSSSKTPSSNKPKPATSSLPAEGLAAIEIVDDYATKSENSLVDIVKKSGKSLGLFQFVGVTCLECRDQWKKVNADLIKFGLKSDVHHVLVFPNQKDGYTKSKYDECVATFFQNSKYAVDDDMELLLATRDDSTKYFGMYILVKPDGTYESMLKHDDELRVGLRVNELLNQ